MGGGGVGRPARRNRGVGGRRPATTPIPRPKRGQLAARTPASGRQGRGAPGGARPGSPGARLGRPAAARGGSRAGGPQLPRPRPQPRTPLGPAGPAREPPPRSTPPIGAAARRPRPLRVPAPSAAAASRLRLLPLREPPPSPPPPSLPPPPARAQPAPAAPESSRSRSRCPRPRHERKRRRRGRRHLSSRGRRALPASVVVSQAGPRGARAPAPPAPPAAAAAAPARAHLRRPPQPSGPRASAGGRPGWRRLRPSAGSRYGSRGGPGGEGGGLAPGRGAHRRRSGRAAPRGGRSAGRVSFVRPPSPASRVPAARLTKRPPAAAPPPGGRAGLRVPARRGRKLRLGALAAGSDWPKVTSRLGVRAGGDRGHPGRRGPGAGGGVGGRGRAPRFRERGEAGPGGGGPGPGPPTQRGWGCWENGLLRGGRGPPGVLGVPWGAGVGSRGGRGSVLGVLGRGAGFPSAWVRAGKLLAGTARALPGRLPPRHGLPTRPGGVAGRSASSRGDPGPEPRSGRQQTCLGGVGPGISDTVSR